MRRVFAAAAFAAASTLVITLQAQQPVFRGESDLVRVFATVTDRDGRIVTTLTQNDFEIRDEGKPQPIVVFDNTPQPIRLVVMLDVSTSMEGNLSLLRNGAVQLFSRLRPDDVAAVGTFGEDITITPTFTSNADELQAALPVSISDNAPTPLWRAVDQAMDALKGESSERRVVLVLSDGKDSGPISFRQRWVSQAEVIDRARNEDVMIYAIGLHSRGGRNRPPGLGAEGLAQRMMEDVPDPGLAMAALQTGGGYTEIRPGQDLGAAFARVADELHSQYLLGFEPPKKDGKAHKIELRVSQRGLTPRARKSYRAPKE